MNHRTKRPYETKTARKSGALVFSIAILALLATLIVIVSMTISSLLSPAIKIMVQNVPQSTPEIASTPTRFPTVTPTPSPLPSATPMAIKTKVQLTGITHQWQKWNNCGPATITMNMSYFGYTKTQLEAAKFLKPNQDDKNVSPDELAAYSRNNGLMALVRRGGTIELLKTFLNHDLPVLVETWFNHDGDEMGHYRLITGYDDDTRQFTTFDSYNGPNVKISYESLETNWRVFNHLYVIIYPPKQTDSVTAIIKTDMVETAMYERLRTIAQAEIDANPQDAIAYFNLGEDLTRLGEMAAAVQAFDQARHIGLHWRRWWYQFTPLEAYYAVGRYQEVIDLSQATLKGTGGHEESYYYLGLALQASGQAGATKNFQAAVAYNPSFAPAVEALEREN